MDAGPGQEIAIAGVKRREISSRAKGGARWSEKIRRKDADRHPGQRTGLGLSPRTDSTKCIQLDPGARDRRPRPRRATSSRSTRAARNTTKRGARLAGRRHARILGCGLGRARACTKTTRASCDKFPLRDAHRARPRALHPPCSGRADQHRRSTTTSAAGRGRWGRRTLQ